MNEHTQEAQRQAKPIAPKVKELIANTKSLHSCFFHGKTY